MQVLDTEQLTDSQLDFARQQLSSKMMDAALKGGVPLLLFLIHLLDLLPLPEALMAKDLHFWIDVLAIAGVMISASAMALAFALYSKAKLEVHAEIRNRRGSPAESTDC